jgi:hypothetical protein
MTRRGEEHVSAWRSQAGNEPPPSERELALGCVYDLDFRLDFIDEAVLFARRDGYDELRVDEGSVCPSWRAVRRRSAGDVPAACLELFDLLMRARVGHGWPTGLRSAGLITQDGFDAVRLRIQAEREVSGRAAEAWREAPIVRAAEELRLGPRPSGGKSTSWEANCPGTNHSLMVHAGTGEWGCGYCCRKGGVEELRKFVAGRRKRKR